MKKLLAVMVVLAIVALGCGDDGEQRAGAGGATSVAGTSGNAGSDGGSGTGGSAVAGTGGAAAGMGGAGGVGGVAGSAAGAGGAAQPQSGTITVSASGVTGHQNDGFLVMIVVTPVGQPEAVLASSCSMIISDPLSVPEAVIQGLEPQDPNPCSASGGDRQFEPGDYDVLFAVVRRGEQMPEKSAKVTVTVDGDVTATAPDYADWRGPDPSLQSGSITVNASGITGYSGGDYLLVVLGTLPNQAQAAVGSHCAMITSDPFSLPTDATVLQGLGDGPCDPTGGDAQFDGGDYDVLFAVIRGGEQEPYRLITVPVVVDGDTTVTAPDYATWE